MRTAQWRAHLLPLLLLSLHSISFCLAAICIFDEYMTHLGPLKIATAKPQPKGKDWEPIRIVASTKDFQGPPKYCVNKDGSIHEKNTKSADPDCTFLFIPISSEKKIILMAIFSKAIALHTDRLLVRRVTGPLLIPRFSTHQLCKYFNVPAEHHTTGVANADMVLYVASIHASDDEIGAVSSGLTCAKSAGGRPIAGSLTFGSDNVEISRHTVRLTAHQIAHALGFSNSEMNSRNMIMNKRVRGKPHPVAVVKSDKTKQMTQEHYGCPIAEGMELEDGRDNNKKTLSHWERRNAKDELMAQPVRGSDTSFMGFYTNITLAVFEELGFYKANFKMAEHMEYGHKAGCGFLDGKCMEQGVTKWPNMFCDAAMSSEEAYVCTTDRLGLGGCAVTEDYIINLPIQFRYFAPPNKGGLACVLTDYCPVVEQIYPRGCTDSRAQGNVHGSLFGKNSMCLDGSALKVKVNSGFVPVGAVCAEISCEGGSVRVKYLGDNNTWHDCPEGQLTTPSSTSESFESGAIKCPKYEEVCTVAPDGRSLVPKVAYEPMEPRESTNPTASHKPTGQLNDSNSGEKSKDSSAAPFGLIPYVVLLVLSFAEYIIT